MRVTDVILDDDGVEVLQTYIGDDIIGDDEGVEDTYRRPRTRPVYITQTISLPITAWPVKGSTYSHGIVEAKEVIDILTDVADEVIRDLNCAEYTQHHDNSPEMEFMMTIHLMHFNKLLTISNTVIRTILANSK